jgi:hypothetical protein
MSQYHWKSQYGQALLGVTFAITVGCVHVTRTPSRDEPMAENTTDCTKRITEFITWIDTFGKEVHSRGCYFPKASLAELATIEEFDYSCRDFTTIRLKLKSIDLHGTKVELRENPDQQILTMLTEHLGDQRKIFESLHPGMKFSGTVNLGISGDVPWSYVIQAVKAVQNAGYLTVSFLFYNADMYKSEEPDFSVIRKQLNEIQTIHPGRKASKVGELLRSFTSSCPVLHEAFLNTASSGATEINGSSGSRLC